MMDEVRDFASEDYGAADDYAIDAPPAIGSDERRMHVRAYNYWVSLLGTRTYPSVEDLELETLDDFGPHGVLLDFTGGTEAPTIAWLGAKLRTECNLEPDVASVAEVPPRSLLSRLTDHYLQIIANCAPIGFEAEFVNTRGHNTYYRGILMPFSSDDDTIDFVYGVINWKEEAEADVEGLSDELTAALATSGPRPALAVPVWADGPNGGSADRTVTAPVDPLDEDEVSEDDVAADPAPAHEALADWLAAARASANVVRHADNRSRAALYNALAKAYEFALLAEARAEEYAELLADVGLVAQARAPMTPIVKLIFGTDYDKTRLTEFAAALTFGIRRSLPAGAMKLFLETYPGGLKAIVAAERRERRPAAKPARPDASRDRARELPVQAYLSLEGDDEFVVLLARRVDPGRVAIIGVVPDDKPLLDRAIRHVA